MTTIADLIKKIEIGLLNPLISLLFVVATVVFFWGIIQYVIGGHGDPKKLDQGKQAMFWGIIGMFIMLSAWAIVNILANFFKL
ncbi:MAG: hypothetical protein HYW89_01700 [Candidatus Sungiibacteriota bacterium]|uniref:Uncharacterized protein n=1 Tax=Candidatus Sungiibacteriota bacterium TaxID=2750080 RepID=A0A7T5RK67_9BACT|nr:MAG: hypothetical protein HYW89_01700 [Candidatus Sungbacteria bacterium]